MTFGITIEKVGDGTYVLAPSGELDAFTAPDLRTEIHQLIEAGNATCLVVDLTRVSFLDSSALGVLVGALRRMRERQGELRLVRPRPTVMRIFAITALDGVFALDPTRDEALAAMSVRTAS